MARPPRRRRVAAFVRAAEQHLADALTDLETVREASGDGEISLSIRGIELERDRLRHIRGDQ